MFVIYNKETTRYHRIRRDRHWQDAKYASIGAARAALTRELKKGNVAAGEFDIIDLREFAKIEKTETVYNLMSGKPVVQSVNTPLYLDCSSETYWSM